LINPFFVNLPWHLNFLKIGNYKQELAVQWHSTIYIWILYFALIKTVENKGQKKLKLVVLFYLLFKEDLLLLFDEKLAILKNLDVDDLLLCVFKLRMNFAEDKVNLQGFFVINVDDLSCYKLCWICWGGLFYLIPKVFLNPVRIIL